METEKKDEKIKTVLKMTLDAIEKERHAPGVVKAVGEQNVFVYIEKNFPEENEKIEEIESRIEAEMNVKKVSLPRIQKFAKQYKDLFSKCFKQMSVNSA